MFEKLGVLLCFIGLHDKRTIFSRTGRGCNLMNGRYCGRDGCRSTVEPLEWPAPRPMTKSERDLLTKQVRSNYGFNP